LLVTKVTKTFEECVIFLGSESRQSGGDALEEEASALNVENMLNSHFASIESGIWSNQPAVDFLNGNNDLSPIYKLQIKRLNCQVRLLVLCYVASLHISSYYINIITISR
jgi:hypothetical protein